MQKFSEKTIWPKFSHIIEFGRLRGTFFLTSQSIQAENVQVVPSFLLRLTGCWKFEVSRKKLLFQWKRFPYLCFVEYDSHQVAIESGHKFFWVFLWKSYERFFFWKQKVKGSFFEKRRSSGRTKDNFGLFFLVLPVTLLKTIFEKANFPTEEIFWPSFLVLSSDTNLRVHFSITHNVF